MQDARELNEIVARESAFVDRILTEVGKVIVGQTYMVERVLIGLLTGGHVLLEGVPGLAKTLTVRADPVHARPPPGGRDRDRDLQPAARRVHVEARPGVREPRPRRRDQPRPG